MQTDPSVPTNVSLPTIVWSVILSLLFGAMACVIVLSGIASYLDNSHPALALSLWPFDAAASARLAQQEFDRGDTSGSLAAAESRARAAIEMAPLSTVGLRVLGLTSMRRGDLTRADRYMAASQRRSVRDSATALWIYARAMDQKDYERSFLAADTIMRRRNDLTADVLFPAMAEAVNTDPAARRAAVARLALGPGWRTAFIKAVVREADRTDGPYSLLAALRSTGHPPTDEEVSAYLDRLIAAQLYTAAYVSWTDHLPPHRQPGVSLLYNGDFRWLPPTLPPFDWEIYPSGGVSAQFAPAPDRNGAGLYVNYEGGLISQRVASQLVLLPSGQYKFSGMTLFNETTEPERLHWLVKCEDGDLLEELDNTSPSPHWRPFQLIFVVPPWTPRRQARPPGRAGSDDDQQHESCGAQRLILEASPGTSLKPFTAWYAALRLDRVGPVPSNWKREEPASVMPSPTPGKAAATGDTRKVSRELVR